MQSMVNAQSQAAIARGGPDFGDFFEAGNLLMCCAFASYFFANKGWLTEQAPLLSTESLFG